MTAAAPAIAPTTCALLGPVPPKSGNPSPCCARAGLECMHREAQRSNPIKGLFNTSSSINSQTICDHVHARGGHEWPPSVDNVYVHNSGVIVTLNPVESKSLSPPGPGPATKSIVSPGA